MPYICHCGVCKATIGIDAPEIPRLIRLDANGRGPMFLCPLGHQQHFQAEVAAEAANWLRRVHPDIASRAWDVRPKKAPPAPEALAAAEELAAREAERVARLNAKIADIDDYLARRGKYAPTPPAPDAEKKP